MQTFTNISCQHTTLFGSAKNGKSWHFQSTGYQYVYCCQNNTPFTGKEKDSETGYCYFGARYYDSDLSGLFLSVDPMADKYPSLSPYSYCAWNPVKLVDPDGKEIWIVGSDGLLYRYEKGKLYNENGGKYSGNDAFANKVSFDLSNLKKLGIKKEIRKMEKSKLMITIREGKDNEQCSLDEDGEHNPKIGSGSVITYNTTKTETIDGKRPPIFGLAHELSHAYDAMNGMTCDKEVPVFKPGSHVSNHEISYGEIRAVKFENRVRPGNNQRRTYDGYDLTPYNVVVKNRKGALL
ncbi:MAG: hypothetical protein K6D59_09900 [Bacteroidales bacterium]|nr:hypothetical protein [Bacteroidales bacterium]